jgi:TolB-like protein
VRRASSVSPVLPLEDLTGDSAQAYLVAGVHDALIRELDKLGLQVTARTTIATLLGHR